MRRVLYLLFRRPSHLRQHFWKDGRISCLMVMQRRVACVLSSSFMFLLALQERIDSVAQI